jgi:hypothetical protein
VETTAGVREEAVRLLVKMKIGEGGEGQQKEKEGWERTVYAPSRARRDHSLLREEGSEGREREGKEGEAADRRGRALEPCQCISRCTRVRKDVRRL